MLACGIEEIRNGASLCVMEAHSSPCEHTKRSRRRACWSEELLDICLRLQAWAYQDGRFRLVNIPLSWWELGYRHAAFPDTQDVLR